MRKALIAVCVLSLAPSGARAQIAGASAGQIFEVGAGGRAPGMGSAYTAVARDVTSLYYNPAGMGLLEGRQLAFMRANLFGGATFDYLGYAQNLGKRPGGWGVQVVRLAATGGEGRDALNQPAGGFSYAETGIGFGMGWRGVFLPELSLGTGMKILTRSLGSYSDKLMGVDFGGQYGPFADETVTLGVSLHNGLTMKQGDTDDNLPTTLRVGAAWRALGPLTLAVDVSNDREIRVGTEYAFSVLALRAGYTPEGMAFGGGFLIRKSFSFDVAVVNNATLGMSQRVSMGYRFGARKPTKLSSLAQEYLANGILELGERHYVLASRDIDAALGVDPAVGGKEWKRKAPRLRELLRALDLVESSPENSELAAQSDAALLAQRAIMTYIEGENPDSVLLAHVAAGSAGRGNVVFMRLLQTLAKSGKQSIVREDLVSAAVFQQGRLDRAVEAIHARRYEAGIRACRESLVVTPQDALAWTRLGSAYFASGNKAKAVEAYQKALQYDPTNQKLRQFMEGIQLKDKDKEKES